MQLEAVMEGFELQLWIVVIAFLLTMGGMFGGSMWYLHRKLKIQERWLEKHPERLDEL